LRLKRQAIAKALSMDGTKIMGRPCKVDYESITEYMANLKKPEGCTAVYVGNSAMSWY